MSDYITKFKTKEGNKAVDYNALANLPPSLPKVTAADDGKFLRVSNGSWVAVTIQSAEGVSF